MRWDEMFYWINPWFISRGETFEKLMRHPKRMLQKQMKLQYIQKIYSSVHFSFVPSIAHWFIPYSATALINLPSLSLNHIIHRLAYKVSQTLSQYTDQSVITDFGQLYLELARSVYPKSSNQKYNSPFIHQVTFACAVSQSLIRHPLTWCIKQATYQSDCTFTHSVY